MRDRIGLSYLAALALALIAAAPTQALAQGSATPPPVAPPAAATVPASAPVAPPVAPAPVPILVAAADAQRGDAGQYAAAFGVSIDEAVRRLRAQDESGPATAAIAREFGARLVGITVEHRPDYRITVHLTGDTAIADRVIATSAMAVPVHFRTGATATRAQILAAIEAHQADIRRALSYPPGMGVDARNGALLVTVDAVDIRRSSVERLTARFQEMTGVPVHIRMLGESGSTSENTGIEGGSRVEGVNPEDGRRYACTTGFVVTDGTRTGVVTAAHCPDGLAHVDPQRHETPMEFAGQWGWGYQDVQLHISGTPLAGVFYADNGRTRLRTVTGQRTREETRAGDFVCHRGERTGYSCAEIELTEFAPPGDLCGGPCLPTWVTVAGPNCMGGDSGAPVFTGTTAYGIVKGASYRSNGQCIFYFYMSTDYLPNGWSLMRGSPAGAPPPQVAAIGAGNTEAAARR